MKTSIIVNAYKGTEPYLEECINSITSQTVEPHELIVVVDGYNKPMLVPNATTIIRDVNMGVAHSRNEGARIATGTHLLFIDGDDVIPRDYLYYLQDVLWHKKVDIAYPSAVLWKHWGPDAKLVNEIFIPPKKVTFRQMLKMNQILVSSLMTRKIFDKVGGFDADWLMFEDWVFFLSAMKKGAKVHRAETALNYRQRTEGRNQQSKHHKARIMRKVRALYE